MIRYFRYIAMHASFIPQCLKSLSCPARLKDQSAQSATACKRTKRIHFDRELSYQYITRKKSKSFVINFLSQVLSTLSTTSLSHNDTLKTLILCLIIYSYAAFFMGNIFNSIMPKIIAITHPHCENGNYKNHRILVLGFLLLETFYSRFHFSMGALKPQKLCPLNCLL